MPAYLGHVQLFQSRWKELLKHFLIVLDAAGATGDEVALPHLAELLSNESLQSAAQGAMWSIFMTCKVPGKHDAWHVI